MKSNNIISTPLVSVAWLEANLQHPHLVILDASMEKVGQVYQDFVARPRIAGAQFMELKNDFADTAAPLPNTVPSVETFTMAARSLGICKNSLVVIYDQHGTYSSPRAWWLFKLMGHEAVAVLDGGLPAWREAGFPCQQASEVMPLPQGDFEANFQAERLFTLAQMQNAVDQKSHCILDARAKDRFEGLVPEPRAGLRSGHMPSAVNLPYEKVQEGDYMKPKSALTELFKSLNGDELPLVCTCGSGVTASILALALEIASQRAAVYDGSWSEWGLGTERPVAVGS